MDNAADAGKINSGLDRPIIDFCSPMALEFINENVIRISCTCSGMKG
jgi:hypothetical protein